MKRSFFGPILFLGILFFLGGASGLFLTLRNISAQEGANAAFVAAYRNGNDYDALYAAARKNLEKTSFLQSEYAAFPATGLVLGLFLCFWSFDRRKMYRMAQELKKNN